jgi:hypothetical protein
MLARPPARQSIVAELVWELQAMDDVVLTS